MNLTMAPSFRTIAAEQLSTDFDTDFRERINPTLMTSLLRQAVPVLTYVDWNLTKCEFGYCESRLPLQPTTTNQHGNASSRVDLFVSRLYRWDGADDGADGCSSGGHSSARQNEISIVMVGINGCPLPQSEHRSPDWQVSHLRRNDRKDSSSLRRWQKSSGFVEDRF